MTVKPSPPIPWHRDDPVPGTEDWHEVANASANISYEWEEFLCWYSPSERRYFWIYGSGCSCNDIDEKMESKDSFENGSRDDAIRALKRHTKDYTDIGPWVLHNTVASIRAYDEPKGEED